MTTSLGVKETHRDQHAMDGFGAARTKGSQSTPTLEWWCETLPEVNFEDL